MLERAFIVAPASRRGRQPRSSTSAANRVGIGSLRLGEAPYTNMFIPLERFVPGEGRDHRDLPRAEPRSRAPWLGLYTAADHGRHHRGRVLAGRSVRARDSCGAIASCSVNGRAFARRKSSTSVWKNRAGEVIKVSVVRDNGGS
jgi:hypothetical protein